MPPLSRLRFARLRPDAQRPTRKHPQDAGADVYAAQSVRIAAHGVGIVPTGITVEIPAGYVGLVKPKGRSDHLVGAGVVDAGYQGELLIKVVNPSPQPLTFAVGDAVAQLLILPIETPALEEVSPHEIHREASPRGASGGIVDQRKD